MIPYSQAPKMKKKNKHMLPKTFYVEKNLLCLKETNCENTDRNYERTCLLNTRITVGPTPSKCAAIHFLHSRVVTR